MMLSLDELEKWGMAAEKQIYDDRKAIDRARSFEKETREAFNDMVLVKKCVGLAPMG